MVAISVCLCSLGVSVGGAQADWAPVQATQLNAPGTSGLGGGGASIGGVTYFGWAEKTGAYITAQHVSKIEGGAIVGELEEPVAALGGTEVSGPPELVAIDGSLYAVEPLYGEGGAVLKLEGSHWKQVGEDLEGVPSLAQGTAAGQLIAGLVDGAGDFVLRRYEGSHWRTIRTVATSSGGFISDIDLLSDGTTPILTWAPISSDGSQAVYADQAGGTDLALTPLNGGAQLNEGGAVGVGTTLATIAGTPYLGIGEAREGSEGQTAYTRVLALGGQTFTQVGGTVQEAPWYYQLQPALGEYGGEPVALTIREAGELHVVASLLSGGAWASFGGPLGVPPLPEIFGDPYGFTAFVGEGTTYAALQQQPAGEEHERESNLFLEAYTAAGVDPLGPGGGADTGYMPTITETVLGETPPPSSTPTRSKAASAVLEALGSPALSGKARLKLATGIGLYCPPAQGTCSATLILKPKHPGAKLPKSVKAKLTVAAGATQELGFMLSGAASKAIRAAGRLQGSLRVSAKGGNGEATELGEQISLSVKPSKAKKGKKGHG
ncbi:MAG TPA: hypothetical protein VHZ54_18325 [Solirubrobacterales bacterium]|jgi:hypothetical protein|nr:hypothetical protein [Solirubrobacterales bacterium]